MTLASPQPGSGLVDIGAGPRTTPRGASPGVEQDLDLALAIASHELRGPLVAARLVLERILGSAPVGLDRRDFDQLSLAATDVRGVVETMDDLLRWSAGRQGLTRRSLDLKALVVAVADASVRQAGRGHIDVTGERTHVRGDRRLLRCALGNLMRNALAYAGPEPSVRVAVRRYPRVVTISVRDLGPGVSEGDVPSIFDAHVRGTAGSVTTGSGLGLYVARRIVHEHGGEIVLTDGRPGTVFRVRLPVEDGS